MTGQRGAKKKADGWPAMPGKNQTCLNGRTGQNGIKNAPGSGAACIRGEAGGNLAAPLWRADEDEIFIGNWTAQINCSGGFHRARRTAAADGKEARGGRNVAHPLAGIKDSGRRCRG